MYHYWGFGLHILSEIEFPELLPFDFEVPDVTIRLGKTPETLEGGDVVHRVRVSISPNEYLLKTFGIANYYARNGNEIIVEPLDGTDERSIRLFLLSNAFAAILHQRGLMPLHASGVCSEDGVVIFCGESGAGKSTLITSLQQQGFSIFTDDICVLKLDADQRLTATASYPMSKLWDDSFVKLGVGSANEEYRIRPEIPKYARYYHELFVTQPMPVKKVVIIQRSFQVSEVELRQLSALQAFIEIQKNAYRPLQLEGMKKREAHFSFSTALTKTTDTYQILRPEHSNSIDQLTRVIIDNLL